MTQTKIARNSSFSFFFFFGSKGGDHCSYRSFQEKRNPSLMKEYRQYQTVHSKIDQMPNLKMSKCTEPLLPLANKFIAVKLWSLYPVQAEHAQFICTYMYIHILP